MLCLCREDRDPRYPQSLLTISRNLPSWLSISHRCHRYIRMSQWSSPCLSTNSWYYWSPWYSTQTLPSKIPIIIHVISIFVQRLSDENVISCSQNYNHPKYSGKFPHWARDWAQPSSKTSMPYLYRVDLRWRDVDCIVNNFYYYLIFILLLLWATLEQKPVKRVAYVKFQLIYTFAPVYLIFFFDITNFNVYISKIHPNWKKKNTWREYSGQRVKSWSVCYWRGFKSHANLSFFFHSSCDIKKIITFYPIVNLTTSNFDFIFHKLAKFTNFYSHSSSLKVISEIKGLIHWMCNLGAAHLHVGLYQPCLIFPLFLHYQSSFSLNVLWI